MIIPLTPEQINQSINAATTPASRLSLALAAVHAARPRAIRHLLLDDIDLGNRRLTIAGHQRPLDELTRRLLIEWLEHRRSRWPTSANPYLIVNQQTAMSTRPVSVNWMAETFRGLAAPLEALRVDRQLDEALTHGPDPLHLSVVFGLDPTTAIRYAAAAQRHLTAALECQDPATSHEPKEPDRP
ncbi:site-specific integrase [Nonomuraea turkmeniaca]|uniref:Site-specific integrase n=1 Tax=Nonomuraea turkmeniaca TaxID=103838 RepID=A0A5S4EUF7_9ACTN|nr:site-specific integrase [Nonomuraea turkmeniaca]TMR04348.1 site-specific integrase [Nonomuraea turkmeniaca]